MSSVPAPEAVSRLMAAFRRGDKASAGKLVELLYPELRRLALVRMRSERPEHTWQPTVLVNELYLELVKVKALGLKPPDNQDEKAAFLGLAGYLMKRLLSHHSRPLSKKAEKLNVEEVAAEYDLEPGKPGPETLQQVE